MSKPETDEIKQADLEAYRDLSIQSRELNWTVERMRKSLLSKLDAGTPIEPGPLDADVKETEQKRMTNDELIRILGLEVVENVRAAIIPTKSRSLAIVERVAQPAAARSRRRQVPPPQGRVDPTSHHHFPISRPPIGAALSPIRAAGRYKARRGGVSPA